MEYTKNHRTHQKNDHKKTDLSLVDTKLNVLSHPLLVHCLSLLRKRDTPPNEFRRVLGEVSRLMAYECSRDLSLRNETIDTPFETISSPFIEEDVTIVGIMRAGMGMLDGFLQMFPHSKVGHIGIYRDKLLNNTVEYYFRIPEGIEKTKVYLLDPLLATGNTVVAALDRLAQYGATDVRFNCLLASQQGIENLHKTHPHVPITCLSVERTLNEHGYLLPGLGDAGDRIFGTQ